MVFAAALLLALAGMSGAETIRSQILDARTGQPIPGAVVLGVWSRVSGTPGLQRTEFVAVQEVETDDEGWFALEGSGPTGLDEESITVYKGGYVAWNNLFIFPSGESRMDTRVPPKILLERFPSAESHRRHVDFISIATMGKEHPDSTPKFWKAIRPEYFLP